MDEAEAKSNVCSISCRPIDGGKSLLFGCGSVIKFSDQNLKVATSRKLLHVLSKESTKVEIIAKFEAQDQEIKLQFATEEESFENEDEGIVYMSFNATEFTGQLPNGLDKADLKEVDAIDCFVPVLENMKQFNGKNKFSFYKVVKETDKCSLEVEIGSNKRSFYSKCQFQEKHLEVLGSPILSKEYKFLGIVDFLEMEDNESLLRINYHDGIQKNFVKGRPSQKQRKTVIAQETNREAENKLSPADKLAKLWNISIDFRDEFSKVLNVKYSEIKYWPHLAEKFGIDKIIYEAFSTSDINSPTETLLDYLGASEPDLDIKEFCESLDLAEANDVCRIVKKSIEAGNLCEDDLVTEICDKAPTVLDTITLKLDREDRLWKNLARVRSIPKKKYLSFQSDRTDNPTRLLFDALAAEGPDLNIKNFKDKLVTLNKKDLVMILNKFNIQDAMPLRDLSKHPDAKSEIETILNNLKTEDLWKLASLYQKEGLMEDIKIEQRFRQKEDCNSPTCEMMEYVISSQTQQYTIEDLLIKLKAIKREDCLISIEPYLKGGKQDIDRITEGIKGIKVEPPSDRPRQVSSTNEEPNGVAATDESDAKNPYVVSY